MPGSPIRRPKNTQHQPPSPTRSEGAPEALPTSEVKKGLEAISMPTLVGPRGNTLMVTVSDRGDGSSGEVVTSVVKSNDLTNVLKKLRPESPDITRTAKRLEQEQTANGGANTGAIAKVKKQPLSGVIVISSPTASTASSTASTTSSSATAVK